MNEPGTMLYIANKLHLHAEKQSRNHKRSNAHNTMNLFIMYAFYNDKLITF